METRRLLTFKVATEPWELEQVYRLNYRTFVEEIPQHQPNAVRALVDRFDRENTYLICLSGGELIGMAAVRDQRPFSLDQKLDNLDAFLPPGRRLCEVRLLSVDPNHRRGRVFPGLFRLLVGYCRTRGYNLAVISGTVRQLKLYRHMGFVPFGPLVGTAEALYQPMYLTVEAFEERLGKLFAPEAQMAAAAPPVNLLPGPVAISDKVRAAFAAAPVSHRAPGFIRDFQETRQRLCRLAGTAHVEILAGSGTLANDAIACQLSLLRQPGVILSNGEFGERLIDQASRFGLDFKQVRAVWGAPFDRLSLQRLLGQNPDVGWLWAVHCETSTGVLNDPALLLELCTGRNIKLCLDCISSIGTVPLDLGRVHLASAVSGKGLGALPGLAMVFYNRPLAPGRGPRYLDLGLYAQCDGIPFTHPSNALNALLAALRQLGPGRERFRELARRSGLLRARLRSTGFHLVGDEAAISPAVVTIALPEELSSAAVGRQMEAAGYLLSYQSGYLLRRNWVQICLMGECADEQLEPLVEALRRVCEQLPPARVSRLSTAQARTTPAPPAVSPAE